MTAMIKAKLARLVPEARFFLRRFDLVEALERRRYRRKHGIAFAIPPRRLRTLVGPEPSIEGFLRQGERIAGDVRKALAAIGREIESFRSILDFGCGCGRQIRWFAGLPASCRLWGSDIFRPAIRWNQRHLPFARFAVNGFRPPLPYDAGQFDLIYAISVFTHLDENGQRAWIRELARVASPGAVFLITTQGEFGLESFRNGALPISPESRANLQRHGDLSRQGFIFEPYEPGGSYGLAFHGIEYIREQWGRQLPVRQFIPRGIDGWQDVVLLEKPD